MGGVERIEKVFPAPPPPLTAVQRQHRKGRQCQQIPLPAAGVEKALRQQKDKDGKADVSQNLKIPYTLCTGRTPAGASAGIRMLPSAAV